MPPSSGDAGLGSESLQRDPAEVGRFRGRRHGPAVDSHVGHPLQELLACLRRDLTEHAPAPDRDKKEQAPAGRPEAGDQAVDRSQVPESLLTDEGIYLKRQTRAARSVASGQGTTEAPETPRNAS